MGQQHRDDFPQNINEIRRRDIAMPRLITIDLATAINDVEYNLAGNLFYIWDAPDEASYINIKVNNTDQPAIPFVRMTGLETPFDKLYISTPVGQTGDLTLLYGTEAPELMRLIDNRSASIEGLAAIRNELQGDTADENYTGVTIGAAAAIALAANADRKGCSLDSLSTNTHSIFLGFSDAVTNGGAPGTWFYELLPGGSFVFDDYRGVVYGISGAQGQILGVGEW